LKFIPKGIHYVYYSLKNGPRIGFFYDFAIGKVMAWKWNEKDEEFIRETDADQLERYAFNIGEFDPYLGYYPQGPTEETKGIDTKKKWIDASKCITVRLMNQILPSDPIISSMICSSRFSSEWENSKLNDLEKVDAILGSSRHHPVQPLESVPDQHWINFTPIDLKASYLPGSTPEQVTKYSIDKSFLLESLLSPHYSHSFEILGELQLCFILVHLGQLYDGFEQWKIIVFLMCHCSEAMKKQPTLFENFISVLITQLNELDTDFFQDELSSSSFLEECFTSLIENSRELDDPLPSIIAKLNELIQFISAKFDWDVGHAVQDIDANWGDEGPTILDQNESLY
jgi:A1 cistron-splicing factor AAR2